MIKSIFFGTAIRVGKTMAESVHNFNEKGEARFIAKFSSRKSGDLTMPVVRIIDTQGEFKDVETSTANVKYWVLEETTMPQGDVEFVEDKPKRGRPFKKDMNEQASA